MGGICERISFRSFHYFYDWARTINRGVCFSVLETLGEIIFVMKKKLRADSLLSEGAKTFAQRNQTYGDSYLNFGKAMAGMFPKGLRIEPGDADSFARLGIFVQIVGKACRYATPLSRGKGHIDSARDIMVYGAILEEITRNE